MFHLRRRKQGSYWYLPDSLDKVGGTLPGQLGWKQRQKENASSTGDSYVGRQAEAPANSGRTRPTITLEYAMALQTKWTSWPNTIWEMNFEDADEEIIFSDEIVTDDEHANETSSKKSVGTLDTDDETMPSCSSPEFQNTWELEDLDLSVILDDDGSEEEKSFACALLACSEEPRRNVLCTQISSPNLADSSGDSNYFLIEESFGDVQIPPAFFTPRSKRQKRLRFADEEGKAIETIHVVDCDDHGDPTYRRILILLLLPEQKKYEFVHCEYSTQSTLTVSEVLKQVPALALDVQIKKQHYSRLCRAAGGTELINALSLQSYDLFSDEILVAVLQGYTGKAMHEMAKALIDNEIILRAVKKTKRCEHTLHKLEGGTRFFSQIPDIRMTGDENIEEVGEGKEEDQNAMDWRIQDPTGNHPGRILEISLSLGSKRHYPRRTVGQSAERPDPSGLKSAGLPPWSLHTPGEAEACEVDFVPSKPFEVQHKSRKPGIPRLTSKRPDSSTRTGRNEHKKTSFFSSKKVFHRQRKSDSSDSANEIGKKSVFQRKPLPAMDAQGPTRGENGMSKKNILQRFPSPLRTLQTPGEDEGTTSRKEAASWHADKTRWASRFARKRWGKLRNIGREGKRL